MILLHEIFNAITMLSPLYSLIKNWKSKSNMKKLMCIHMPISILYHISCAFPNRFNNCIRNSFRSLDYVLIHATSLTSHIEFMRKHNITLYVLHAFLIMHTMKKSAIPFLQYSLFFSDNSHFFNINQIRATMTTILGSTLFMFYISSFKYPYCHGLFHIGLYWIYQTYFELYNNTMLLQ